MTNVARAFSGAAGITPSLKKAYGDNGLSASATESQLAALSKKIDDDFKAYKAVQTPNPADPDPREFQSNLRQRQGAIYQMLVDCGRFYGKANQPQDQSNQTGSTTNK